MAAAHIRRYFWLALIVIIPAASGAAERRTARVDVTAPMDMRLLQKLGVDIDRVDGRTVHAYVNSEEFEKASALGLAIAWEPDPAAERFRTLLAQGERSGNPLEAYHDYDELTAELQNQAASRPDICLLLSAGRSVQNRELWVLKISDHPATEEDEPEFRYISTIHGDEPVGTEMLIYLIRHLIDQYGVDAAITGLVDETEIYILPLLNPDGNALGSRYNANGVDINRDFPDRISDPDNTPTGREAETRRVMTFFGDRCPVMSANFHGGALVMNYPWDSTTLPSGMYAACPDDDVFIHLAETYAAANSPMWNSPYFEHGITNGNDWYALFGGLQDWNYNWMGCLDLTGEISNDKWPGAAALAGLWENNRDSLTAYLAECHRGVRGVVTDVDSGQPVAAVVTVTGRDMPFYTDPDVGDFHRCLLPGAYQLRFEADGYQPAVVDGIVVEDGPATRVDVSMSPLAKLELADVGVAEIEGNNDVFLDPGETWGVALTVWNGGMESVHGVTVALEVADGPASIRSGIVVVGTLAPGAAAAVAATDLRFKINGDASCAAEVVLRMTADSDQGSVMDTFAASLGEETEWTFDGADVPKPIPDGDPAGTVTWIAVTDLEGSVAAVTVRVDVTHPYVSDLSLFLIGPNGTVVELSSENGGSEDDYIHTVFDQRAATAITAGQAPFTGAYRPEESLDMLRGVAAAGMWGLAA
ncbi:MAG TPA: M14 family zinc carboxypeptidase, partial [Acidobacteriota bacterium]|nr:M14 family zinc carboxypeptidase [Acidobacteriota bacterium]